jgi:hypothetical protein
MRKISISVASAVIALGLIGATAPAQAQAAAPAAGSSIVYSAAKESVAQHNARRMAAQYLKYESFSRSGLIGQLEYEGFTASQARYGVKKAGL